MKSTCHNSPVNHYKNGTYCSVCFKEQHKTNRHAWVLYTGLSLLLMMPANPLKAPSIGNRTANYNFLDKCADDIIPNDSSVLEELVANDCVLSSVAVAQARIESANYTSDIAINNKNLFGIKFHDCKYVTGKRSGHATFASYRDNIACYCEIQQKYLGKINRAYAEDTLYIQKVRQMR